MALGLLALLQPAASAKQHQTLQPTPLGAPASPLAKATTPKLPPYVPGEVIVRFEAGVSESAQAAVHSKLRAKVIRHLLLPRTVLVELSGKRNERAASATYERQSGVALAQPNFIRHLDGTFPNDPTLGEQWGLHNVGQSVSGVPGGSADADIDAPEAWQQTTGSPLVKVAVVDSGVDTSHPDLAGRTVAGYDFIENDATPQDTVGHGTAMAGIIGAAGNDGAGITGVNWNVRIMPLRACDATSGCTDQRLADAFTYADTNGATVVNASLSGPSLGGIVHQAISNSNYALYVVSAGNGGADGQGDNNDTAHEYPCDFTDTKIVCVTSTNQSDQLTGFANYSATSVDIAAPGLDVLSDWPGGQYAYINGTSASTAYVSGAAALSSSLQANPGAAGTNIESTLLNGGDVKPALAGKTVTGKRLNAAGGLYTYAPQPVGQLDAIYFNNAGFVTTNITGSDDGQDVAVQNDGKIVVAGRAGNDFGLARYNTDGTLDTSFDGDGKVTTDLSAGVDQAYSVAIDPATGKIVAGGYWNGAGFWAVARYNTDGSLDTTFDGDGKLLLPDGAEILGLAVQTDSKIVAVGEQNAGYYLRDFEVMRINPDGSLDSGFGVGGRTTTDLAGTDVPFDVKVQNDGKIVVAGTSGFNGQYSDFAVARYNGDGSLDTSFSGDGKQTTDLGHDQAHAAAVQPDGKIVAAGYRLANGNGKIVFESTRDGNSEIYSMNSDGSGVPTNLTNNSAADSRPSPAPDGSLIAFTSNRDGDDEIYTMNPDGTGVTQLTFNSVSDKNPTWSPDDTWIAYQSNQGGDYEIYRMLSNGAAQNPLTSNSSQDERPEWSPDGTKIVFDTNRDGNEEIYTADFNNGAGGNETRLTNNAFGDFSADWSPDGTKIVFDTDRDVNKEIYVMNANGTGQTDLTNNGGYDVEPSWSPDGTKITWDADRGQGNFDVYSMNANGSAQAQLTSNAAADFVPDWVTQPQTASFALARYNTDGSLDTSFDGDGTAISNFAAAAEVNDVLVQDHSDRAAYNKITAVGTMWAGGPLGATPAQFAVARYNQNGSLDSTFDTDGRVVTTGTGQANATAVQSNGNILVAGTAASKFAIARYMAGQARLDLTSGSELNPAGDSSAMLIISGFEPNDQVQIQQCREGAPSNNVCFTLTTVTLNSSGGFGTAVNVDYTVHGSAASCEDPYCDVRVASTTSGQTLSTPISFRQPATLTGTPSAGQVTANQAITLGQSVTDTALVQGNSRGGTPGGSVSFFWCGPVSSPTTCRGGNQIGSAVALTPGASNSASATSASFTPGATGRYCLRAAWSGDTLYRSASDDGSANCIMVRATAATFAAVDDPYTAFRNFNFAQQAQNGLLQNDIHPGAISVQAFSGPTAQGGTVTVNADGSFSYTPALNYVGPDSFTYTATDGGSNNSAGTALIEVTALDPLEYTKYRYTKYRYTKYRDIAQAQLTVYAFCGPRFVSVNPQVTLFEPTLVQLSAALYDAAGNRLLTTPGYLANGEFGGDPFQPNILAWPDWTTPAPAGGAYVEVLLEADFDTAAPYTERVTAPCAT